MTKKQTLITSLVLLFALLLVALSNDSIKLRIIRTAANMGYAPAQWFIGGSYQFGDFGDAQINMNEAMRWYHKSAKQGYDKAQMALCVEYHPIVENGLAADADKSLAWCLKAANQGYADAQLFLAIVYAIGEDVPEDLYESYIWALLAAEQGKTKAQERLSAYEEKLTPAQISAAKEEAKRRAAAYQ